MKSFKSWFLKLFGYEYVPYSITNRIYDGNSLRVEYSDGFYFEITLEEATLQQATLEQENRGSISLHDSKRSLDTLIYSVHTSYKGLGDKRNLSEFIKRLRNLFERMQEEPFHSGETIHTFDDCTPEEIGLTLKVYKFLALMLKVLSFFEGLKDHKSTSEPIRIKRMSRHVQITYNCGAVSFITIDHVGGTYVLHEVTYHDKYGSFWIEYYADDKSFGALYTEFNMEKASNIIEGILNVEEALNHLGALGLQDSEEIVKKVIPHIEYMKRLYYLDVSV